MSQPPSIASFLDAARAAIGAAQVLTADGDRDRFERDFWNQNRGRAAAVLRPGSTADVARIARLAAEHQVAIVPQSGNTGLVRGGIPDESGTEVVLSFERMDKVRAIDPAGDYMVVEAGCVLQAVQQAAAEVGRFFPLAMGSGGSCRIGGNLSTNAGGINVLRYGMARDLVLGLEVVLADGSVLDLMRPLRKDNTGYDLKQLFIGAEGTLGIITAAALRLAALPRERVTVWLAIRTPEDAIAVFKRCRDAFGELISAFELLCSDGIEIAVEHLPNAQRPIAGPQPWHLLIDVAWMFSDGLRDRVEAVLGELLESGICLDGAIAETEAQRTNMWRLREEQSLAASKLGYIIRSDVTVPIAEIPSLLAAIAGWRGQIPDDVTVLPFGHLGDGNLHVNFLVPAARAKELYDPLLERLYDTVDRLRGSISAEHGIGRAKRKAVWARKPAAALDLSARIKRALDPDNRLNPGVVLDPSEL
ncbi:MAG TPA: FAD-binding oxidoreductase [Dongiaceae bacterium]|nr:FAD-binding oxidoreductase [Dongiaceae bacterium]